MEYYSAIRRKFWYMLQHTWKHVKWNNPDTNEKYYVIPLRGGT